MPTISLPKPHATQARLLREARRYNVVALGRRAGKSTLAQHVLALRAVSESQPVGYFAPTYKLLAEFWREVRAVLAPVTSAKSEQDHRLELRTGGVLECWSLDDPNPARGRKYGLIVVDEAAMVRDLLEIWQLALRPTLTDLSGGAWFMSTPRGLNDFWALYQYGQDPLQDDWASWQMPTAVNPFIRGSELDAARAELPERAWAQEYLAEFLQLEGGGVFRGVQAIARLQPAPPVRGHSYVIGVDWGRTNDFTAISVFDSTLGEQVALDRFSEIDYEFQTERLHRWANAYRPTLIVAEANSMGRPLVERLQTGYARILGKPRASLPVWAWEATNASKAALVQALSIAIERGAITLLDNPVQRSELLAYEATVLPSGMVRYGAPSGQHDDTVIALGLSYLGSMRERTPTGVSRYAFESNARRALPSGVR
jgi:hypothetical protein